MESKMYSFVRTIGGVLMFRGSYHIKFYKSTIEKGVYYYKDTEIDSVKDLFYVQKKRIVKTGKAWKENYLKNK